jgi:hypothetical protein
MEPTQVALLKALRQPSTGGALQDAVDQAVDRLIASSSLAESQQLVFGLQQCVKDRQRLYSKLQQAAAISTEPPSKAQFLGFVLLQESVHIDLSTSRATLFKVLNANHGVLSGFLAALTAEDGPFLGPKVDARRTLSIVAPVIKSVLVDAQQAEGHKAAVLDAVSRIAWHFDGPLEQTEVLQTDIVHLLVQALELVPHLQLPQAAYAAHVAFVVDLLSSFATPSKQQVALAARTARFVLEATQILIVRDVGVVALLQSLEQLAQAIPQALWCSLFLTSAAYFLVDKCETPMEQKLMLRMLAHVLEYGRDVASGQMGERSVYVEILTLPLSSMISLHGGVVSELLQLIVEIEAASKYRMQHASESDAPPTETATHARSAVRLLSDEGGCQSWLDSLFSSEDAASSEANRSADKWLALLLVALLSDARSSLRSSAAKCLERQVNSSPKFWGADSTKALVASLVFLVSQQPTASGKAASARRFGGWMASSLYSLAALAATTTDTMRIILRLIDTMNGSTKMRSMALKLMYEVWRNESRVFPRLEALLLEPTSADEDVERHVVKMATIKTLCEKDPELGVQFIASIQAFLEDELESVVSMGMDAITALCGGDCLDFYVAFKIIYQKMRKNKVRCVDEPLFQERLCCLYALGGAESAANEKHAAKLLHQAWEFADSEHPRVRKAAYAAMCPFPLEMLGLCLPDDNEGQDSGDEDQMTEEEVEEQVDELMQRLQNEPSAEVRGEIEKLMARVIDRESTRLTAGVGRGQRMASAAAGQTRSPQQASQQSRSVALVSAAATKEMRALLPSRIEVRDMCRSTSSVSDWSGFLLAYQPKAVIDAKNAKRKDKLVRLATQNVDELEETVATVVRAMEFPWASAGTDANCSVLSRVQALMEGWRGFMSTYTSSLEELADLKTPVGVDDADVAFRVFSEGVANLIDSLLRDTSTKLAGALAAGALTGQLCESRHWQNPHLRLKYEDTVEELSRQLALSLEQARVFSSGEGDARVSSIGASIALQLALGRRQVDASEDCSNFCSQLVKMERMLTELLASSASDELLGACALLGLSHIAALYTNAEELETFEATEWRQQRVKPIAERILLSLLHPDHATQQSKSASSSGDVVFPLYADTGSVDSVAAQFDSTSSSSGGILLRWASSMGLARVASGMASIKRLDWLKNVRHVLEAVWEVNTSVAVALGPVLLQCVHFNLVPSSSLETFATDCIQRAADAGAGSLDSGFVVLAAAHVLCREESLGGFPRTIQNQTSLVVELIRRELEGGGGPGDAVGALMLSGIANFFRLSFGVSGSLVRATLDMEGSVELALDPSTVATLVKLAQAEATKAGGHCDLSCAVLGAIARAADGFYVSQKKKSFDVELRNLPPSTLLAKSLEWLRLAEPSDDVPCAGHSDTGKIPERQIAESLLTSLTSSGSVLPLLDYASLAHRVMLRFCSVATSVACVRFMATQGSCDELLASELLSSTWFGSAHTDVQVELIAALSTAACRVPTGVLENLLKTTFDVLKDGWRRDTSSSSSVLLFDCWTWMLRDILDAKLPRRIPESSLEMVNQLVLEKIIVELPFGLDASLLVQRLATRVLSKVSYGERGPADAFLMPSVSSSMWSWWRNGVFIVELASVGVLPIAKREASLLFQWILRHDFDEWTDEGLVGTHLQPLMARIGALVAQHTRPGENVSSLLDAVDAFSRGMASLDASVHSDVFKRRALFDAMACVLSWNSSLCHEQYLLRSARSAIADADTATELLPFGLLASAHSSKPASALAERLLALLVQLNNVEGDEAGTYRAALQVCSRQMYVAADSWHTPSTMPREIREVWSLTDAN